jgi:ribosome-associated toxin RatA of RatAB toxin-antitoxin module
MRRVTITASLPTGDPDQVFAAVRDFTAYPRYSEAVRSVEIINAEEGATVSDWTVRFRNGLLCWTERDEVDAARRTVEFTQLEGDFDSFSGAWRVDARPDSAEIAVEFTAEFDLGMPSMAEMLDPIAEQALRDTIGSVLRGLLGENLRLHAPREGAERHVTERQAAS